MIPFGVESARNGTSNGRCDTDAVALTDAAVCPIPLPVIHAPGVNSPRL
ncbi:MAG: hypothetical protein MUP33_09555 [Polaromonas sp.]|nr:hypothetical protein [Polaromonas sp.]